MIIDITKRGVPVGGPSRPNGPVADGAGDEDEEIFHVEFDPAEDDLGEVIPRSIAALTDQPPLKLDPLGRFVDLDRINGIIEEYTERRIESAEITFNYEGFVVTVNGSGHLWIERI